MKPPRGAITRWDVFSKAGKRIAGSWISRKDAMSKCAPEKGEYVRPMYFVTEKKRKVTK
jgi:hypothetical protein